MNIGPNEFKPPGDCKENHKVSILKSMANMTFEKITLLYILKNAKFLDVVGWKPIDLPIARCDTILFKSRSRSIAAVEDVRYWTFQNKYQDRKLGTLLESAQKPSRGQKHSDQLGHNRSLLIQLVWQHVLNTLSSSRLLVAYYYLHLS